MKKQGKYQIGNRIGFGRGTVGFKDFNRFNCQRDNLYRIVVLSIWQPHFKNAVCRILKMSSDFACH
jgi:hypothetical protein